VEEECWKGERREGDVRLDLSAIGVGGGERKEERARGWVCMVDVRGGIHSQHPQPLSPWLASHAQLEDPRIMGE